MKDSKQMQMLSLGALLHDFEHFHSGINIARALDQMSKEELEKYKGHPLDGCRRVQDKQHFDQQVLNIIGQHEECADGSGYPNGYLQAKIDPLALIVGSANKVDRLLTFERVPRADLARKLMLNYTGKHPLDHLKILGELTK